MRFWDQVESWEIILFVGCLAFVALYFGQQVDFENIFKKESATPVHMSGNVTSSRSLPQVEVLSIPQYVYDTLDRDDQFKRYLTGNHKYVFFFTYPGCRYSRAYTNAFQYLFEEKNFEEFYRKRIISVGRTTSVSCPGHRDMNCATAWMYQACFGKLCIINPQRKQVVVDASQNAQQLEPLLEKYKEW